MLDRFPAERIEHQYASAADIAQSISDALDTPGLVVRYRDHGVFVVGGRAAYPDRVRDASTRVAADLAPLVRGIEVAVAPRRSPTPCRWEPCSPPTACSTCRRAMAPSTSP